MKTNVRILLCGYYFQGNTGDDLMMESIKDSLSRYGEVRVTSTETFDADLLNWCDLLVLGAGSLITPRGIGGYRHAKYAKENGKKIIFYSQTIEEGHPMLKEHLARANLITVRDPESKKVAEDNGFRAVLASDPIFKVRKRTIGFSFRKWVDEPPGIEEVLASVLDNLTVDYEILSVPYTRNDTDTESDTTFHEQIIHNMKNKPRQAAYVDAIESVDLLIGMRLHALINAVNKGKKVLAIDYDAKIRRIFTDLKMGDMVVPYGEVDRIPHIVREKIFRSDGLAMREKVNVALIARICADIVGAPKPTMSVVMPTYNRAEYLKEAIDSILAQTVQDWELIIIDDGSLDNTREVVESYKDSRIKYYNFGHNGIAFSRNIGNLLSTGEIIAVADSDDINLPNRLEVTCKEMEKGKADIIYSSMFHFYDTGEKELIPSHPFSHERLKEGNFIYHPAVAYRRDIAMSCPYDEDLTMVEDYHMYLQAAAKGHKFHQVEEPLVMHRLHDGQISSARSEEMAQIHKSLVDIGTHPMVSVIIPTYNRPEMLKEALMSVLSQTYQNFEVIVVNDAGKDVAEIIDSLNNEGKIIYLQHKENKGLPAARNTCLKVAKGKYIAYLDDDDIYYPDHIQTLVEFLKENSGYKAAYTDSYHVFQEWITDRYVTVAKKIIYSQDFDQQQLLLCNYIPVLNVMHRRDLFDKSGLFDEGLRALEDWEMWIRLSQHSDFYHIKKTTAEVSMRSDGTTMTSSNRMPFLEALKIIHERYRNLVTNPHILEDQKKVEWLLAEEVVGKRESVIKNSCLIDLAAALIQQKGAHIGNLEAVIRDKDVHIGNLEAIIRDKDVHIGNLEAIIRDKDVHIGNLEAIIRDKDVHIGNLEAVIRDKDATLNNIYNSHGWRALLVYYKVRDRIFPVNSRRRKAAKYIWNFFKIEKISAMLQTEKKIKFPMTTRHEHLFHMIRRIYHRLPIPNQLKWRLRERLWPLVFVLREGKGSIPDAMRDAIQGSQVIQEIDRDSKRELALMKILRYLGDNCKLLGPVGHVIALPFLGTGGAEMTALNFAKAIRALRSDHCVLLAITDRALVSGQVSLPDGVLLLVLDDFAGCDSGYVFKQKLLRDLLLALRPKVFHNINSEVAWQLILNDGERLHRLTKIFASIFAFQFAPDGITKIGYAANFFRGGFPYLTGVLSDNHRFVEDAIAEYSVTDGRERLIAIYAPSRIQNKGWAERARNRISARKARGHVQRPRVLWAGRLDADKRVDLFLEVVKCCPFADFEVFGQVVVDGSMPLETLPNLVFRGPFSHPEDIVAHGDFDAFVFTSKWEGMPNILLEIGSLGIPIVAPVVGGVGELITEDTGYPLAECPEADNYAEALKCIWHNPADAAAKAECLVALIDHRHNWDRFLANVASLPGYIYSPVNYPEGRI